MTAGQALSLIRKLARQHGYKVAQLPGRGKGSHSMHVLLDSAGNEVTRFGLTGHTKDMSWTMLRAIEDHLANQFGEKWMEK
jgi:hypothetical protein